MRNFSVAGVVATLVLALAASNPDAAEQQPAGPPLLRWSELPELPEPIGFAAPFAGVSGDALIVAGGANFPEAPPWEGGRKVWHDRIFVLPSPEGRWRTLREKLPRPNAYGVSITLQNQVICIGGCAQKWDDQRQTFVYQQCYDDVFVLRLQGDGGKLNEQGEPGSLIADKFIVPGDDPNIVQPLPRLPRPLAFMSGARIGETIYLAGGQDLFADGAATTNFWRLDLSKRTEPEAFDWEQLPWPINAPPRVLPVCAAQNDGRENCLFMFSGRDAPGHDANLLRDGWKFTPSRGEWTATRDTPRCLMAGVAVPLGVNHILTLGGDSGELFGNEAGDEHPGFAKDMVFLYDAVTDRWTRRGDLPANHVTTNAVHWNDAIVIPSGEIRPGVRSPKVWAATVAESKRGFVTVDWVVMGLYMLLLVGIGFYFSRREHSTDDFFLAGRRVPWWAAGMSIFATMLSAITYLSIPAKTFNTDWAWFLVNMGIVAIAPIVAYVYLPFYRRLNVTTAYEYLEKRFSLGIRLFGSLSFIVFQLGRMGIVVLLPALALSAVTGIDVYTCIIVMGVLSTIYTVLGGIEAVIWTDVLQTVVLVGGAIAAVAIIAANLEGGLPEVARVGYASGKLQLAHFEWNWTGDALMVIVLGALFANLVPYTSDQAVIQRYLTTSDEARARGAIWTNALLSFLASILFFGVGTALFVFYRAHPAELSPIDNPDQIFPWFIAHQMPAGLSGLVIAGVFAASMSSLDSSMHSVSTAVTTDFFRRFQPQRKEDEFLNIARVLTVVLGVAGTGSALLLATLPVRNLWELFMSIMGLFAGTLAGLFALGIFTRRTSHLHAWIGAAASIGVLIWVTRFTALAGLLNAAIAIGTCVLVGWLVSYILPLGPKKNDGLTIFTIEK